MARNAANIIEMGKMCKIQLVTQVSTSIPDYKGKLPKSLPVIFFSFQLAQESEFMPLNVILQVTSSIGQKLCLSRTYFLKLFLGSIQSIIGSIVDFS